MLMATPTESAETGTAVRTGARAKLSAARRPENPQMALARPRERRVEPAQQQGARAASLPSG
jgi:hypothetical protein